MEASMCGIVGYIGKNQAAPIVLDGLSKLESTSPNLWED